LEGRRRYRLKVADVKTDRTSRRSPRRAEGDRHPHIDISPPQASSASGVGIGVRFGDKLVSPRAALRHRQRRGRLRLGHVALPTVTFVGRWTVGALLNAQSFELAGGALTVPVQGVWGPDGPDYRDRAVAPDIAVAWTRDQMCNGPDPDVAAALKIL